MTAEQYQRFLGDLMWTRADTLVWLDLPRPAVMQRVIGRSLARVLDRRELWNGNREDLRAWLDPGHPVRWAWSRYDERRAEYSARMADPDGRISRWYT